MRRRFLGAKPIDPFKNVGEPFITYENNKSDLRIYLLDANSLRDAAVKQQLVYIKSSGNKYFIMIEKELYDLIPDYYSEISLSAQADFFSTVSKGNIFKLFLVGLVTAIISTILLMFIFPMITSSFVGVILAILTMFLYINTIFKKQIDKERLKLRKTIIKAYGETKLDQMIDILDEYVERRTKELMKEVE